MTDRQTIELVVSLRVPDVVAATAFRALRDRLNFSDSLHSLKRHDYYRFELSCLDESGAENLARALIERTTMFVNPNKHQFSLRLDDRYLTPRKSAPALPDGVRTVSILVLPLEAEDERTPIDFLRRKLDQPGISAVSSGVLWELFIRAGDDRAAQKIALDIAVARRRTAGLLLNPHYQRYELI